MTECCSHALFETADTLIWDICYWRHDLQKKWCWGVETRASMHPYACPIIYAAFCQTDCCNWQRQSIVSPFCCTSAQMSCLQQIVVASHNPALCRCCLHEPSMLAEMRARIDQRCS